MYHGTMKHERQALTKNMKDKARQGKVKELLVRVGGHQRAQTHTHTHTHTHMHIHVHIPEPYVCVCVCVRM
jgi:hypothetical protein